MPRRRQRGLRSLATIIGGADRSAGSPRAGPGRRAFVIDGFSDGAARTCAPDSRGARSVRHAHHAVAEALRLHLAHMTSPLAFDGLLADHRAALLFERLVLVPWMGSLRSLGRGRQRKQRNQQYDHSHLSLRVGFAICEINLRASRAFCEFFVTLACRPYAACRRGRACGPHVVCSAPRFSAMKQGTRRYGEARKRQERSPCAPGWLACAVTSDTEILPTNHAATGVENPDQGVRMIAPGWNRRPDLRTVQQTGREFGIPDSASVLGRRDADLSRPRSMGRGERASGQATFSEDPARTIEPALFLGRKRLDGMAGGRGWPRKGGRWRRVTHGPPVMRAPVVAGGEGRLPENQQSGEGRRGP